MTKPTGRPRGRPRKDAEAAPKAEENEELSLVDQVLAGPVQIGRKAVLQPDDETLQKIAAFAKLNATKEEVAAVLGVSSSTFHRFLANNEVAEAAWSDGKQFYKLSLRSHQMKLAGKLAPVAIFLGKNDLGQRDDKHVTQTVNVTASEMSEEQLIEIAQRGAKAPTPGVSKTRH